VGGARVKGIRRHIMSHVFYVIGVVVVVLAVLGYVGLR
jgi:hypothetical protein